MRTAFINELTRLAADDPRITFITGDLGYSVIEEFAEKFPDQFLNAGVAEQNMTGIAAGMALSGRIVFTYSIANFPTLRCLEQIRNDICYHDADVKIVAVGGGLAYGTLGYSHHAVEDLAIMRALGGMRVVAPADPIEAASATAAIAASPGPWYLRLGKAGEPICHTTEIDFELGRGIVVREGSDLTLISTGGMLETALNVAEVLAAKRINLRVVSMHTVKPLDTELIAQAAAETNGIVTLEEHSCLGGLGSAVAEALASAMSTGAPLRIIGLPPECTAAVGTQEELRRHYGLSVEAITAEVERFLGVLRGDADRPH